MRDEFFFNFIDVFKLIVPIILFPRFPLCILMSFLQVLLNLLLLVKKKQTSTYKLN